MLRNKKKKKRKKKKKEDEEEEEEFLFDKIHARGILFNFQEEDDGTNYVIISEAIRNGKTQGNSAAAGICPKDNICLCLDLVRSKYRYVRMS